MPARLALAALVVLALSAQAAAGAGQPTDITILFEARSDHSAVAFQEWERETAFLMRDTGLSFRFQPLSTVRPSDQFTGIVVVRFRGVCRINAFPLLPRVNGPLASTHSTDGKVLPFIDVECDRVRACVRSAAVGKRGASPDQLFGRALARVVAHELYHVMANTARHGLTGIAQRTLSGSELIADRLEFHPDDLNRLIEAGGSD